MESNVEFKKLFAENKCLKPMSQTVNDIYKLKNKLETIIDKKREIPKEDIEKHRELYNKFSKQFFDKEIAKCILKRDGDLVYEGMKRTKINVINLKKKLGSPFVILFFKKNVVKSYKDFLDLSEELCNDFIKKYEINLNKK